VACRGNLPYFMAGYKASIHDTFYFFCLAYIYLLLHCPFKFSDKMNPSPKFRFSRHSKLQTFSYVRCNTCIQQHYQFVRSFALHSYHCQQQSVHLSLDTMISWLSTMMLQECTNVT
jgi:hypothetical protein